jgi:NADH-quinone oxidoreductase subunit G
MFKLKVNDIDIEVEEGLTVLQACEQAGVEIPRFCYHEKLSIAGNCRMCLVEMEKSPKPIASCAMPVAEGMVIKTNTEKIEKSRKGVMEFLLANHPLDCPVCDQGGECDLQDQSMFYGIDKSRFKENKRYVPEKYMGPLIKTQMTRCIHCTRCIRFATEVAGVSELGAIGRGENMQITTYLEKSMESEMSANVIDLCPVGALTSKPYVFKARPWELKKTETIDVMDAVGSNIRVDTYGWEVKRVLPRINEEINEEWISDKTRYACDGLKNQRLDVPLIKNNNKFEKISWTEAYKKIVEKISKTQPEKIAGITGDMTNMETLFVIKEFFEKIIKSNNLDSRSNDYYVNSSERKNYIFNSNIEGLEESDLIILVGTNPRFEATILNSRIRRAYLKNKTTIYSVGDVGDLTYPYAILDNNTKTIKDIVSNKHEVSTKIINAKKPIIVIGQSVLKIKSGIYIFEELKKYLLENNKINNE